VDTLRIDSRFVRAITGLAETAVVRALLTMASDVGLEVVADGVETAVQGSVLRRAGCHLAQGDFFSPPIGPGELEHLVRASQAWAPWASSPT
jgi:EAL domain-containing protein (putative c-di-GMP-specific phosphodiesterase class I)